jgi:hypothetical protein
VSDQSLVYEVTAASEGTINVTIALVGFWDQIPGVGTAVVSAKAVSGTDDNLSVNVSTNDFALSTTTFSAVANRAMRAAGRPVRAGTPLARSGSSPPPVSEVDRPGKPLEGYSLS